MRGTLTVKGLTINVLLISRDKRKIVSKAFSESRFSYCPLIWMLHSRILNEVNRLHEKALRTDYSDFNAEFDEKEGISLINLNKFEEY